MVVRNSRQRAGCTRVAGKVARSASKIVSIITVPYLLLSGFQAHATEKPLLVGDDFQTTVEVVNPTHQLHLGDYLHVKDARGQSVGLVRITKYESGSCIAIIVEGVAPKGSTLLRDQQISADRNPKSKIRAMASVDMNSDKVGAPRRDEIAKKQNKPAEPRNPASVTKDDEDESWSPIKGFTFRKLVFVGVSPTSANASNATQTPQFNYGFNLGGLAELTKGNNGFEVGLEFYQAGFNYSSSSYTYKYVLNYVGIPILYKRLMNDEGSSFEWHLKGGLTESFLVSKKASETIPAANFSYSTSSFSMSSTDTLLTVGADIMFPMDDGKLQYWAQATFGYGLTSLKMGNANENSEIFNASFGLFF